MPVQLDSEVRRPILDRPCIRIRELRGEHPPAGCVWDLAFRMFYEMEDRNRWLRRRGPKF